jgi:hypothetical protein
MNLNVLEKLAREVKKSNQAMKSIVNPTEHKDLSSLSTQIAANLRANGLAAEAALPTRVYSTDGIKWL